MPNTIGAAIIAAANWTIATVGGVVAPGSFITPFAVTSGTILGFNAASFVGTVAITGLSVATMPQVPSQAPSKIAVRNPVGARRRHYGLVRVSGHMAEVKVSEVGEDGILYTVTMLMTGEIDGFVAHFLNDQETRIDGTGQVTYPGVWNDNSRVQLYLHFGEVSQTADANLIAAFPGRWTDKHRLDGVAYVVGKFNGVALEDFATVYQAGVPNYSGVIRAAKVWDPRDATQSASNPDTWTWTQNAALIIMDYLWHQDGMRLPRDLIDLAIDDWIAKADKCDEQITLIGGGTEARYRLSSGYEFIEPPKEVLKRMLAPIDGRLRLREDSAIVLDVGEFETPTEHETFSQSDIISYTLKRGAPKTELKNEIRATYTSPGHNFQPQEADPWRDEASIALDGEQSAVLDLSWCPSHRQARQRMKVEAYRQNPEWLGTIVTNARGLGLMGKRYARFVIDDLTIDETFFIIRSDINILAGACTFEVVSFPSTAYDWTPAEEGVSPEQQTPGDHGIAIPAGTTEVTITADGAGGGGSGQDGGGGGARAIKTIAIDPADWGTIIRFTVGAGGYGDPPDLGQSTDGGDSIVTGSLVAGPIAMVAGGGKSGDNGDAGGIATGGDTNTNGNSASGGDGGTAASGAIENEAPGGGGHEGVDGGHGLVTFDWVY